MPQQSLKEARKHKQLNDFIKEHEADPPGDLAKLDKLIKHVAQGNEKEAPKASSQDASDD